MRTVKELPTVMTVINDEGHETHEPAVVTIMPAAEGTCPVCATVHDPWEPHNAQSLYYQICFNSMVGRGATWADALAHCAEVVRVKWTAELKRRGVWSEPPAGEQPVRHHGVDS